jgi:uncharacterized membrane protein
MIYDEIFTYNSAKSLVIYDPNMAFFDLIAHFWENIFPNASDGMLRVLPAIFSILSIPVVFLLGKEIENNKDISTKIGLLSALLVSLNAFHINYAQFYRSYSLVFLLTSLSTLLLIMAIKNTLEKSKSFNYW